MSNAIERDVYVLRNTLKNPISYVRGTDLLPIIFHFRDFTIPSGATATAFTAKPDGNAVYGSATISENDVTVDVQQQMFIVLGLSMLQVEIKSGEETLATFVQPVMVEPNLKAGDFPPSTTDINFLDKIIEQAQEAVDNANQAVEDANTAISGANTAASSANQAAQNANQAAEDLQDKVDAGDFTASVQVGTTTTLEPGQDATVSNGGTSKDAVLNFGIPKGDPGAAATIQVGTTQTVQPEENAEVTNTGTASAAVLDFKIPRGADGMTDLTAEYKDASEYTCEPTVNAPAVVKELDGKTEQVQTEGNQLFNYLSIDGQENSGISARIDEEGYINLTGTFALTHSRLDISPSIPIGEYTISIDTDISNMIGFTSRAGLFVNGVSVSPGERSNTMTAKEELTQLTIAKQGDGEINMRFRLMLNKGSSALDWEPYTGGQPSPSPDYPQAIKGVGGMGYFDGVWRKGVYQSSNGAWQAAGNGICSQNPINAKAGDNVTLKYPDEAALVILAYKNDGTYLGNNAVQNANEVSYTLPTDTAYVHIDVQLAQGTPITPSTAKYCTVTINGEYATGLETQGRNLAEVTQTNKNQTISGVTFKLNDDGSYTLNGTCTETAVFLLNQPDGNDISNFPTICKLKVGTKYRITGSQIFIKNSTYHVGSSASTNAMVNDVFYTPTEDTYVIGIRARIATGTTYSSTKTYYPGIWEDPDETRTEWAPFKRTSITIPLTAPLYEGDKICYVKPGDKYVNAEGDTVVADGVLYGVYRENVAAILDGSGDESLGKNAGGENIFSCTITNKVGSSNGGEQYLKCNKLTTSSTNSSVSDMPDNSIKESGTMGSNVVFFNISEAGTTVESLRTWLSTNPLTVVYRLAAPYFEPFTDQSIFYDLRTDDILTYIYSSDPIEPNVTVEVAKNSTGGYLLESYAQAQKNAISEANSQSRISAIEQQLVNQATTPTE